MDTLISSQWSIVSPDGQRRFPSTILRLSFALIYSFSTGLLVSVFPLISLQIEDLNLPHNYGVTYHSFLAPNTIAPQAYHPQANGLVERFHRHLKSALRARLKGPRWIYELPWVLLVIRTSPKEDIRFSLAELVYGAPLTVPGQFLPRHGALTYTHTKSTLSKSMQLSIPPIGRRWTFSTSQVYIA